jgi:hypothetical protein
MKNLALSNSDSFAVVDDKDYQQFKDRKWYKSVYGYAICNAGFGRKGRKTEVLHQLIIGKAPKPKVTDHINGNRLDNRRENLRFVSRRLNNLNSAVRKNVGRHQGAWTVRIGLGHGKKIQVSGIKSEAEARSIMALLKGALIYHELTKGGSGGE